MDTEVKNGWCYIDEPIDHPDVRQFRGRWRFHLKPETVDSVSRVANLSGELDVEYYRKWAKRIQRSNKLKETPPDELLNSYRFVQPPFEHQYTAIAFGLYLPACALFLDTGTGKTYVAIQIAEIRKRLGQVDRILVVAPKKTLWTAWYDDCRELSSLDPIVAHKGAGSFKWYCPLCGKGCYKISDTHAQEHYRSLRKTACIVGGDPKDHKTAHTAEDLRDYVPPPKEIEWNQRNTVNEKLADGYDLYITSWAYISEYQKEFLRADWDMVILDESTKIKTPSSNTARAAHRLGHQANYRLAMTGTPMGSSVRDIWSQMYFVDQSLGPNISEFNQRYFYRPAPDEYPDFWVPSYDGVELDIRERISNRCLRITKEQALDLPERDEKEVSVSLSEPLESLYETMDTSNYATFKGDTVVAHNSLTETHKLQQITNGHLMVEEDEYVVLKERPPKLQALLEIIKGAPDKSIVWAQYKADFDLITSAFDEEGVGYRQLHGDVTGRSVDRNIRAFKRDPKIDVMLAHPGSAMFGLTWNEATTTVYYSYSYDVLEYAQSRARNHRLGQEDNVQEIVLIGSEADREVFSSVKENLEQAQAFADDFQTVIETLEERHGDD